MRENLEGLVIRNSRMEDYKDMLAIYERARNFMRESGNPRQWNTTWPPADLIKKDIEGGKNSFVCVDSDGDIVATFFFMMDKDITYDKIYSGMWKNDGKYGVVHRIAVSGKKKGVGGYCLNWAFEKCKADGRTLRIDTHGDNLVMQKLLKRLGFVYCGIIYVEEDNDPRLAFEKTE